MTVILRRVARPLLATIFVTGGINALRQAEGHAKAAEPAFRRALLADLKDHPEWDRILNPEKYKETTDSPEGEPTAAPK